MKRIIIVLAAAMLLAGCGGQGTLNTGIDPVKAAATVQRVEDRYLALKPLIDAALPFLPPSVSLRVMAARAIVERALISARLATTIAAQQAALHEAEGQVDMLSRMAPSG